MDIKITKFYFLDKASQAYAAEVLAGLGLVNVTKIWSQDNINGYRETLVVILYEH